MSLEGAIEQALDDAVQRFLESSEGEELLAARMEEAITDHERNTFHLDSEELLSITIRDALENYEFLSEDELRGRLQELLREYNDNFPGLCSFGMEFRDAITRTMDWHDQKFPQESKPESSLDSQIPRPETAEPELPGPDEMNGVAQFRYVTADGNFIWDGHSDFAFLASQGVNEHVQLPGQLVAAKDLSARGLLLSFVQACDSWRARNNYGR